MSRSASRVSQSAEEGDSSDGGGGSIIDPSRSPSQIRDSSDSPPSPLSPSTPIRHPSPNTATINGTSCIATAIPTAMTTPAPALADWGAASAVEYAAAASFGSHTHPHGSRRGSVVAAAVHGAGDRQWSRLMDRVLRNEDPAGDAGAGTGTGGGGASGFVSSSSANVLQSARPVVGVLRRVLHSASFRHYTVRHLETQFNRAFLIQAIGQYVSSNHSRQEVAALLRSVKHQLDDLLPKIMHLNEQQRNAYKLNIFPNSKQSRMFALQYALHKKGATVAAATAAASSPFHHQSHSHSQPPSCPPKPTFYITTGSPMYSSVERFLWELMLPRDSFRLVPTKRQTASAGSPASDNSEAELAIPTFEMDVDALAAMLERDIATGHTPVAVVGTLGSDVAAASALGGGGVGGGAAAAAALYQMDDIAALGALARKYDLWLHVEGSALMLAALPPSSDAAPPRALAAARSVFDHAHSVSTEVLGWFDLYGSMAISFFRQDLSATGAGAGGGASQPPGMPLSREVISNLFLLWFQLVSREEGFIQGRVERLVRASAAFRARLLHRASLPFPVLVGPTGPGSDLFPQFLYFQAAPNSSLPSLDEFALDGLNSFNAFLFARMRSHVAEGFGAREFVEFVREAHERERMQQQHQQQLDQLQLDQAATPANALAQHALAHAHAHAHPAADADTADGPHCRCDSHGGEEGEEEEEYDDDDERHSDDDDDGGSQEYSTDGSESAHSEYSDSEEEYTDGEDEEADGDTSVPLSTARRRALLALFDSSFSLSVYQGRLGFLFHPLSSVACSSCLQSTAEARQVEWLLRALSEEMEWMRASLYVRQTFAQALDAHPELRHVPRAEVAPVAASTNNAGGDASAALLDADAEAPLSTFLYGVGAFQYVPSFPVTDQQQDRLNVSLAHSLAKKNSIVRNKQTNTLNDVARMGRIWSAFMFWLFGIGQGFLIFLLVCVVFFSASLRLCSTPLVAV